MEEQAYPVMKVLLLLIRHKVHHAVVAALCIPAGKCHSFCISVHEGSISEVDQPNGGAAELAYLPTKKAAHPCKGRGLLQSVAVLTSAHT